MSSYLLLALCRQFLIIVTESFDTQFLINHKRKNLKRTDFTYIIYSMAQQDISYLCFIEQRSHRVVRMCLSTHIMEAISHKGWIQKWSLLN